MVSDFVHVCSSLDQCFNFIDLLKYREVIGAVGGCQPQYALTIKTQARRALQ